MKETIFSKEKMLKYGMIIILVILIVACLLSTLKEDKENPSSRGESNYTEVDSSIKDNDKESILEPEESEEELEEEENREPSKDPIDKEPALPPENPSNGYEKPIGDTVVKESSRVDKSYFDDAVFIGDSRVEGFILYNGLSNTTSYTHKGLSVNMVLKDPIINKNGELVSIIDALKMTNFSKVYLMMGVNELGWVYSSIFIQSYEKVISEIKKINPNATIYVQSILPVSDSLSSKHSYIRNERIVSYNKQLLDMTSKNDVYYVNVYETMIDEFGALPEDAAYDGIHLKKGYCNKWLDYLLTHIV